VIQGTSGIAGRLFRQKGFRVAFRSPAFGRWPRCRAERSDQEAPQTTMLERTQCLVMPVSIGAQGPYQNCGEAFARMSTVVVTFVVILVRWPRSRNASPPARRLSVELSIESLGVNNPLRRHSGAICRPERFRFPAVSRNVNLEGRAHGRSERGWLGTGVRRPPQVCDFPTAPGAPLSKLRIMPI
jgi:hypothetical protein